MISTVFKDINESAMQELAELNNLAEDELHLQATKHFNESQRLVFKLLPTLIAQIIETKSWNKSYKNFGEYALDKSSEGLGVANNNMLWLLRSAMETEGKHAAEWGDVLNEVDSSVRVYAKENKIAMKDLSSRLNIGEAKKIPTPDDSNTYLPSRSSSNDGQLLKLRSQDEEIYKEVVTGKMSLKDALPYKEKKPYIPLEFMKSKFQTLSMEDRAAFISWVEEHI